MARACKKCGFRRIVERGAVALIVAASSPALLAEPKRHTDFFEKDFAGSVMSPSQATSPPRRNPAKEAAKTPTPTGARTPTIEPPPEPSPSPTPEPTPDALALRDMKEALPVERIGAIINAKPPEALFEHLQKLVDLSLKFDRPVGRVWVIGPLPRSETDVELMGIAVRGGALDAVDEVPAKYSVSRSPSWILETAQGEIVIEGFDSLERFLNSKGDYVAPSAPVTADAASDH